MRMMRWPEVRAVVRLSRSTVWRMESGGGFPRRRRLSVNSVGWIEDEVREWVRQRAVVGGSVPEGERSWH
jgi:prophage regulatory protein